MMVWLGWDADGNYIWTQRGYMYRESLALLSTQYVGTYLGMMVWLGWDGNDPAAASSLSFPHMPTTLPIYRQVTLQKHTIMKYGVQISEFRIREIPLVIYRRMVSLQKHRINEKCSPHDKYEIWPIEIPLQSKKNVTQTILKYECTFFVLLQNWIKFSFNLNFIFCLKLLHYVADNLWSFQISCNIQIIFRNKFKVSTLPGAASKFGLQ